MSFIPSNRCVEKMIKIEPYKYPVPILYVKPTLLNEDTKIIIFLGGLDGTNAQIRLMNYSAFNKNYLLSYERMGSIENRNNAKRWMKCYVCELDRIVDYAIKKFGNRKLFLAGESWGGGIASAYYKKHKSKISGVAVWNIPDRVQDSSGRSLWYKIKIVPGVILSVLFGLKTYDPFPDTNEVDILSSNDLVRRIKKINIKKYRRNNVSLLAAWWAIKPSWKRIKEFLKNEELPFFYIQSKQDKMMHFSFFNKILQLDKYHKCHVINGGYHVLSAEEKWGEKLFELIDRLFILS